MSDEWFYVVNVNACDRTALLSFLGFDDELAELVLRLRWDYGELDSEILQYYLPADVIVPLLRAGHVVFTGPHAFATNISWREKEVYGGPGPMSPCVASTASKYFDYQPVSMSMSMSFIQMLSSLSLSLSLSSCLKCSLALPATILSKELNGDVS
jgi:hypothetical protein